MLGKKEWRKKEHSRRKKLKVAQPTSVCTLATMVTRIPDYLPNADALVHSAECLKY